MSEKKPPSESKSISLHNMTPEIGNELKHLYEAKSSADTYSIYCAIGQLMTHSLSAPKATRTLVIPAGELSDATCDILRQLNIETLEYQIRNRVVQFE
jgi:hypothetical protein